MQEYKGLSPEEVLERRKTHGENRLAGKKRQSAAKIFAGQFRDVMVMILLAATAVSAYMGEIYDAITIIAIVLMNAIIGFIQEYRTERTLEALEKMTAPSAKVIRGGKRLDIAASELVPGDIFLVEAGDRVPADGKISELSDLRCDESILTGESGAVKKSVFSGDRLEEPSQRGVVYMGASVVRGNAVCETTLIGMATQMGKVSDMINAEGEQKTPLQKKLGKLGGTLCAICLIVCSMVALAGILRGEPLLDMLMTGITIAIAAIPEGLPATVTIALALAVRRMLKQNALVHKLHSVETLGCTTVICTDKTGTLTENKMTVTKLWAAGEEFTLTGSGYSSKGKILRDGAQAELSPAAYEALVCAAVCNNAKISPLEGGSTRERKNRGRFEVFGEPTEAALLIAAEKCSVTENGVVSGTQRISEIPFDSDSKKMTVTVRLGSSEMSYTKGAPDVVVAGCTHILTESGVIRLDKDSRRAITEAAESMANSALRVLAMCKNSPEGGIFLGLAGMQDAPREEAVRSIRECKKAGIRVVMITGDHLLTAKAVAKEVGILRAGARAISKTDLDKMSDQELARAAQEIAVYARVSPSDKLRIVNALKSRGNIVAMTGDGVNDAPAIKAADIGVAMGKTGTDVCKQAADVILLDDDFSTLCLAVRQGRTIFSNIRKLVRYLISCNIGEVAVMFLSILLGMPVVLLPTQILLVNLVTDGLPAVALGLEKTEEEVMQMKPRDFSGSFASGALWLKIALRGALIGACTLGCFAYTLRLGYDLTAARTSALITLILSQLIHVFECRSEHKSVFRMNPFGNPALFLSVALSAGVLAACVWWQPLAGIMQTAPLTPMMLLPSVIFAVAVPLTAGVLGLFGGRK